MSGRRRWALAALLAAGACAPRAKPGPATPLPAAEPAGATTQDAARAPEPWELPLAQIPGAPEPPAPHAPATRPTTAPSESLDLFIRARLAMLDNQRFTAVNLLERAVAVDPESFELRRSLAQAYLLAGATPEKLAATLRAAVALRPDDLRMRLELGRQLLIRGDAVGALVELRTALLLPGYESDAGDAALVDYFLARCLQQLEHDRAAIDAYARLAERLEQPTLDIRSNRDLAAFVRRPQQAWQAVGELYEKRGLLPEALEAYERAAEPGDFELEQRIVRVLTRLNRTEDAAARAARVVRDLRGSPESVRMLREIYGGDGVEPVVRQLRALRDEGVGEPAMTLALAQVLAEAGRVDEAATELQAALAMDPRSWDLTRRLFDLHDRADRTTDAARLLVEASARDPGQIRRLGGLWARLTSPARSRTLRSGAVAVLDVPAEQQPARDFWAAQLALQSNRPALARERLAAARAARPVFAPAWRVAMNRLLAGGADRAAEAADLLHEVEALDRALGLELSGLQKAAAGEHAAAVALFEESIRQGNESADVRMALAEAARAAGRESVFEQTLARLMAQSPGLDDAAVALFGHFAQRGDAQRAIAVTQAWRGSDPQGDAPLLVQASILIQTRQTQRAESLLRDLLARGRAPGEALAMLRQLYEQTQREEALESLLRERLAARADDLAAAELLMVTLARQDRADEALAVAEAALSAVGSDADRIYYVSHLFTLIDRSELTERALERALAADPAHTASNNDLGYMLADRGERLSEAEAMIRRALADEPDNISFLDSLGWVLYKQGRFDDAVRWLEKTLDPDAAPDAVVLDHLGDALYRVGRRDEAAQRWREALRHAPARNDEDLTRGIAARLAAIEAGTPPPVAAIAGEAPDR